MGEEKRVKAKVVHKNEYEKDWLLSNYVPDVGEVVFYKPEIKEDGTPDDAVLPEGRTEPITYTRQKNGDGINKVKDLPFDDDRLISKNDMAITNSKVEENSKRISTLEGLLITHIIDDSEAYMKKVPTQAAPNAILNRVGGKTIQKGSKNICTDAVEGGIPFETNGFFTFNYTLPKGTYWIDVKVEGDEGFEYGTDYGKNDSFNVYGWTNPVTLDSEATYWCEVSGYTGVTGRIYPMIIEYTEGTEIPTEYEPYEAPSLEPTKVTEIVSRTKNEIVFPYISGTVTKGNGYKKISNGVTWTVDAEGNITANGKPTGDSYFTFMKDVQLPIGNLYFSGCAKGGRADNTYFMSISTSRSTSRKLAVDEGNGASLIVPEFDNYVTGYIKICYGTTVNNLVFKPTINFVKNKYQIPIDIQNKEGYGTDEGYIDFDRKKWVYGDNEEDISHILNDYSDYKFIEVFGGGEIVAENENKNPVPWTVTFAMTSQEET